MQILGNERHTGETKRVTNTCHSSPTTITACNLVDDEPPDLGHDSDTDGARQGRSGQGRAGQAECLAAAEQIQSQCLPPQQFIAMWNEGNSAMILVDDPAASVGIGPGGWLVQVGRSDAVGASPVRACATRGSTRTAYPAA